MANPLFNLSAKIQQTKFGSWVTEKFSGLPEQPIIYGDDEVIFIVQVKIQKGEENKARKEKKGDIVKRRLKINARGLTTMTIEEPHAAIEFFPFPDIKKFFYAPDNCFVAIEVVDREFDINENRVFNTSKQAPVIQTVINEYIERLLKAREKKEKKKEKKEKKSKKEEEDSSPKKKQERHPDPEAPYDPWASEKSSNTLENSTDINPWGQSSSNTQSESNPWAPPTSHQSENLIDFD